MNIKYVFIAFLFLFISACKVEVYVPAGTGKVVTKSGELYPCNPSKSDLTCVYDVVDVYFSQTFIAKPAEGYVFDGWLKQSRGFCGGSKEPCLLETTGFEEFDSLMAILEDQNEVFYLSPRFNKAGAPKISLPGTWTYVETHTHTNAVPPVSCEARGELLHTLDKTGHKQQLQFGSKLVFDVSPCELITVPDPANIFSPATFGKYKVLSGDEIKTWNSAWSNVIIHSKDSYTIEFEFERSSTTGGPAKSISGRTTYTRKVD